MNMQLQETIDPYSHYAGLASMAAIMPHRAAIIGKIVASEAGLVGALVRMTEHQIYQGFLKTILMPVGVGLSVWNAFSAIDRIMSTPTQDHLADYFLCGSSSCGALAATAVFTPIGIPVAGVLGLLSLGLDVVGAITTGVTSNDEDRWKDAGLQLGLTLLFGFDEHHYQAVGRGIKGEQITLRDFFAPAKPDEVAAEQAPPPIQNDFVPDQAVDRGIKEEHTTSRDPLTPTKPDEVAIEQAPPLIQSDFVPSFVASDEALRARAIIPPPRRYVVNTPENLKTVLLDYHGYPVQYLVVELADGTIQVRAGGESHSSLAGCDDLKVVGGGMLTPRTGDTIIIDGDSGKWPTGLDKTRGDGVARFSGLRRVAQVFEKFFEVKVTIGKKAFFYLSVPFTDDMRTNFF